jgi:hypothetical protein
MVVAACGDECSLVAHARLLLEAEHADVERKGTVDVGHLQVDVADVDAGIDAHESLTPEVSQPSGVIRVAVP